MTGRRPLPRKPREVPLPVAIPQLINVLITILLLGVLIILVVAQLAGEDMVAPILWLLGALVLFGLVLPALLSAGLAVHLARHGEARPVRSAFRGVFGIGPRVADLLADVG